MAVRIVVFVSIILLAATLLFFGVLAEARAGSSSIVDGAQGGGNPRFFFLPPLAPQPETSGEFDADASPSVEVCLLEGEACAGGPVETLSMGDGLRVNEDHEHYLGLWNPQRGEVEKGETYRFRSSRAAWSWDTSTPRSSGERRRRERCTVPAEYPCSSDCRFWRASASKKVS